MGLKPRTGPRPHSRLIGPDLLCSKEGKRDKLSGQAPACQPLSPYHQQEPGLGLSPSPRGGGLSLWLMPSCHSGYIFGFHRREQSLIRELDHALLAFQSSVRGGGL